MVILVDDEDRENEGDLVMAAEKVTPEAINFMARHARGLICLTLTEERVRSSICPMMVDENRARGPPPSPSPSRHATRRLHGHLRARPRPHHPRRRRAGRQGPRPREPGHIFPLRARPGGVLQRTGHTEGSVDLARLAGLRPRA
jgi:3,4-dihydroxy 2-butanone 4-phosphate synthase/GTP cyclohydrolase II